MQTYISLLYCYRCLMSSINVEFPSLIRLITRDVFLWLWRLKTYKIASLHVVISYDLLWQNAVGWQVENVLMFIVSWVAWRQGSEKLLFHDMTCQSIILAAIISWRIIYYIRQLKSRFLHRVCTIHHSWQLYES